MEVGEREGDGAQEDGGANGDPPAALEVREALEQAGAYLDGDGSATAARTAQKILNAWIRGEEKRTRGW